MPRPLIYPNHKFGSGPLFIFSTPPQLIDIIATCVDVGAVQYPSEFQGNMVTPMRGYRLRSLLTGTGEDPLRNLYWEHEENAAIRAGDQILIRKVVRGNGELFDLKSDRTEQINLAEENPKQVALLRSE